MTAVLAVTVLSAAVLAYEVLLVRLFAIVQWHHFAYMAIAIALLGFGASGTFLSLARRRLVPRFEAVFAVNAALFGVTAMAGFVLGQRVPFNALAVLWQPGQLVYLAVLYGLFTVPFFVGANCIGLALTRFGDRIGGMYGANLAGSALGALGVVGVLFQLEPSDALRLVAGLGFAAGAVVCLAPGLRRWAAVLAVAAVVVPLVVPASWTTPRLSPFKALSAALAVKDAAVIERRSGPLAQITVVRSPAVPFRHAPGLSLNNPADLPPQLGLFSDGDGLTAITRFDGGRDSLAYLGYVASAAPYHLLAEPTVLVLGAGGGADVLQALYFGARAIDGVELNPQIVRLVAETHRDFAGGLFTRPDVRLHAAEARGFVATADRAWDLIQIPLLESSAAAAAGVHGLAESYVYTTEAFGHYLDHLRPGGLLAVTRWLKLPPRDSLKLLATARDALIAAGVPAPDRRLVLLRSWNTTTLLVKNGDVTADDIARLRAFATARAFDLAYYPGMPRAEANRFNVLTEPYFHDGAVALLSGAAAAYTEGYKFDIRPARDDRPYFFDFFTWRSLPEFVRLHGRGGVQLLELGYPILVATLGQSVVLAIVLILAPLLWRGSGRVALSAGSLRILGYFACLGLAFMFVEIALIQRFILFLSHPLYAVAVVLSGILVCAGLGSAVSRRLAGYLAGALPGRLDPVTVAVVAVVVLALLYAGLLPRFFAWAMPLPAAAKIGVALALIAPLGFFMGMPFPLGLSRVSAAAAPLVPWAWGVNGCFSVIAAVLATVVAIHGGFTVVVAGAALFYLLAAVLFRVQRAP